jgi:hypothetical protein
MGSMKTVFRRIGGRIIPIRVASTGIPSEIQKIVHIQKARAFAASSKTFDEISGVFYAVAKRQAKETGAKIARRIARLRRLGIK